MRAAIVIARQNLDGDFALGVLPQRQIAEQRAIAGGGGFVVKRALDFHPAEGDGRLTVPLRQRIAGGPGPITEKASGVGDQRLVLQQRDDAQIVHRRVGSQIELTYPAHVDRALGIHGDGLVAAAPGHGVAIGRIPAPLGFRPPFSPPLPTSAALTPCGPVQMV